EDDDRLRAGAAPAGAKIGVPSRQARDVDAALVAPRRAREDLAAPSHRRQANGNAALPRASVRRKRHAGGPRCGAGSVGAPAVEIPSRAASARLRLLGRVLLLAP